MALNFNKFAKFFTKLKPEVEVKAEKEVLENAQGKSQEELDSIFYESMLGSLSFNAIYSNLDTEVYFKNKKDRVAKYREMSLYPEISDGVDNIVDDAVVEADDGTIVSLDIDEEKAKIPKPIEAKIRNTFDYVINDIYNLKENGWKLFKDWLVDSELYLELIMDKAKTNIIGFKKLPSFTMTPIYKGDKIIAFQQHLPNKPGLSTAAQAEPIIFTPEQIVYINYGRYGKNLLDVRGYLEAAIRPYNQLRSLEDSLVVYRLVRAPERKVWNIDVGKMPKGKAKEFIRQMIQQYKKKSIYDPNTGKVNSTYNVQSMTEDYWFAKTSDGKGTSVETIGGNMQLGELTDLNYFLQKLYKVLKLPKSRYDKETDSTYSAGRIGEISRAEVKFANFIHRLQGIFKYIILQPALLLLKMRGIDEKYIIKQLYNIKFTKSNLFVENRELEMYEKKFGLLGDASTYIVTGENEDEPEAIFAKEFVIRNIFKLSDEDFEENEKMKLREKKERELKALEDEENGEDEEEDEEDNEEEENDNDEEEKEDKKSSVGDDEDADEEEKDDKEIPDKEEAPEKKEESFIVKKTKKKGQKQEVAVVKKTTKTTKKKKDLLLDAKPKWQKFVDNN